MTPARCAWEVHLPDQHKAVSTAVEIPMNRFLVAGLALITPLLAWHSATCRSPLSITVGTRVGLTGPDFSLTDADGRLWRLRELRGQPVVLIFACGCADCHQLLRGFASTIKAPVHVLVISTLPPAAIRAVIEHAGAGFPGLFDPFSKTATLYSSIHCPQVWVMDEEQVIRYRNTGSPTQPDQVVRETVSMVAGLSQ
jgi:cytochrome c biogenesis protein CcmG/thiol:disulfide interchange protein DsbE